MATHDYVLDNASGAAFRTDLNNALAAIVSNNSNNSAPSTTYAYQWWADTSAGVLKIRNSGNSDWIELLQLDGTLTLEDGAVGTPALAFRDDLNTGIYSSAADTFNVATGGVERMELGATTIFNEDGADVDFRIEGDTNANLFYVDAGNDAVGIGTSSPLTDAQLTISAADAPALAFQRSGSGKFETAIAIESGHFFFKAGADSSTVAGLSNKMKIESTGDVIITDGDLVVGTAGHGISFINQADSGSGETVSSSILDEYEEGSFDVEYNVGSAGSAMLSAAAYASTGGLYTKIGDMVHFQIRIKCSSHSAQGGRAQINGLPFTHTSSVIASGAYVVASQALGSSNNVRLIIDGTNIIFQNLDGTEFGSGSGGTNWNNEFHCAGIYKAAS